MKVVSLASEKVSAGDFSAFIMSYHTLKATHLAWLFICFQQGSKVPCAWAQPRTPGPPAHLYKVRVTKVKAAFE